MAARNKKTGEPAAGSARPLHVLVVSGLSGAGKSTVLKALEDLGYETVDNLPLSLLPRYLEIGRSGAQDGEAQGSRPAAIAVGVDSRTRDFTAAAFGETLGQLRQRGDLKIEMVFLTCEERELGRRFTETRRRHPLAGRQQLASGIAREKELLAPLRDVAEYVFDSTALTPGDMRRLVSGHFALGARPALNVAVDSFAYRRGLPHMADLVFDTRFLVNPHYDPGLRDRDGRDAKVGAFIEADPTYGDFYKGLSKMLLSLLPLYAREGKSYLTLAFGCTGGRHRSVFVAEQVSTLLRGQGYRVSVRHRDVDDALE